MYKVGGKSALICGQNSELAIFSLAGSLQFFTPFIPMAEVGNFFSAKDYLDVYNITCGPEK